MFRPKGRFPQWPLQDDTTFGIIAHLLQCVDCFLGSSRPGGWTHLETEVWEEPLPASWGRTEGIVPPRSFAETPFWQLSINRETVGHCQLDSMNPSVRRHPYSPLFPISWLTFPSRSISASHSCWSAFICSYSYPSLCTITTSHRTRW